MSRPVMAICLCFCAIAPAWAADAKPVLQCADSEETCETSAMVLGVEDIKKEASDLAFFLQRQQQKVYGKVDLLPAPPPTDGNMAVLEATAEAWPPRGRQIELLTVGGLHEDALNNVAAKVDIGGQEFNVTIDTGSATFGVAASSSLHCVAHYSGSCDGAAERMDYTKGSWSGKWCSSGPTVSMAGVSAGKANFVGIMETKEFLETCDSTTHGNQGIAGFSYSNNPAKPTLFDQIVQVSGIPDIFSIRVCAAPSLGALVLGGSDPELFTGTLQWTPITHKSKYCVNLVEFGVDSLGKTTVEQASQEDTVCNSIVDSGTETLRLAPAPHKLIMAQIEDAKSSLPKDEQRCIEGRHLQNFPTILLGLKGTELMKVPPTSYYMQSGTSKCLRLSIEKGSKNNNLGFVFLSAYYAVFDRQNSRLGFAPSSGCGAHANA